MKLYVLIMTCTFIAGFSGTSHAALVGSPRPIAQENFQRLIKTNECPSCDLAGVVLTRVDLSGANLEGANLAGAKMYLANLAGANLKHANLQGTGLGGTDLAGADLRGANLTGAILEGAYLKGAQLDGRIIAYKPYQDEDLPQVSEKKYVAPESRGKNVPYTQDELVAADRAQAGKSSLVDRQEQQAEPDRMKDSGPSKSKSLVPMADAVEHTPLAADPADGAAEAAPEAAPPDPAAGKTGQDGDTGAKGVDSGFWASVVSIFRSGDSGEKVERQPVEKTAGEGTANPDEIAADTAAHTGRDELAPDASVLAMIEQIEGPAPAPEEVASPVEGEIVAAAPEAGEPAAPAAGSAVGEMIAQIETDQVEEDTPSDGLVYGVVTPEQARAMQQAYIDRLLDDDRCVACDLAGVDLSGKRLGDADLERANLQGANLEGVDLSGANLKGVNFSGANLKDADLRAADLYLADFTGTDLTGARFDEALIDSAVFTDATGVNLEGAIKE